MLSVPSKIYPLSGAPEVFTAENTKTVTDNKVLAAFDGVEFKFGCCYTNTEELAKVLRTAGINNFKTYGGWLFADRYSLPVHHCWIVYNGESVLDLSDDFTQMYSAAEQYKAAVGTVGDGREFLAEFISQAKSVKNSVRCVPVGQAFPRLLYIGAECEPDKARATGNYLLTHNHPSFRNCDSKGRNGLVRELERRGVTGAD